MNNNKMDKKTLKKFAEIASEVYTEDPVYKYAAKIPAVRKRFIYHFMMERLNSSNGEDIIYIDTEERGICVWRDAKNDYTVFDFLKCPHWVFLVVYWISTVKALLLYSRRDLSVFPDNTLLVEPVFVAKEHQGKGVASSLIKKGIDELIPQGYSLGLETQSTDNVRLYEKLGFRVISKQTLKKDTVYNYSMLYEGAKKN